MCRFLFLIKVWRLKHGIIFFLPCIDTFLRSKITKHKFVIFFPLNRAFYLIIRTLWYGTYFNVTNSHGLRQAILDEPSNKRKHQNMHIINKLK